ncbi:cortactin-binding protein 2 [Plakobranchus ocellatus]|uniref:Cortactin-binding protein 2 n=1 Tax=Plakobranchus ocellatus TaxID=259542 RepID=A0AAV3XVR0_9GAST|nr:cortactin-binding protein 2 [Plakobranchus ocellatus]
MAARNLKPGSVQGYQSEADKAQPSTLKRQPNPDWSKNDLLRLLSYFEGELQARDITIATLKAEKAKQLLYQAKYGRFGLGDPFVALQRDAEGKNDTGFDEAAIKSMYDNQLAQLENLIATQRKAQLKMREQLGNSEKRFHKVCTELEDEKKKHAHDTAQGDDVTYMLEKERERLKAEIDFEKSQNKKLEKDLKKTLASLEEERANAARHKQVAIMLIKERKNLIERLVAENQLRDDMESALTDGKSRMQSMAEGLAEESKKSLKMEAALERQNQKFDGEREALRIRLQEEEKTTGFLKAEISRLSQQLETLQYQIKGGGQGDMGSPATKPAEGSQHLRASSSPLARVASPVRAGTPVSSSQSSGGAPSSVSPNVNVSIPQVKQSITSQALQSSSPAGAAGVRQGPGYARSGAGVGGLSTAAASSRAFTPQQYSGQHSGQHGARVLDVTRPGATSPDQEVIYRPAAHGSERRAGVGSSLSSGTYTPARSSTPGRSDVGMGSTGTRINVQQGSGSIGTTAQHGGGKISFHVSGGISPSPVGPSSVPVRRGGSSVGAPASSLAAPVGRGVPPPIPPNKPNFVAPVSKPSLPPKGNVMGAYGDAIEKFGPAVGSRQQSGSKAVQIPVKVISSNSSAIVNNTASVHATSKNPTASGAGAGIASVHTQVRDTSPSAVRKTSQCVVTTPAATTAAPIATNAQASPSDSKPFPAVDSGPSLEFLGPEMANLQQLLAIMTTENNSTSTSLVAASPAEGPSSRVSSQSPQTTPSSSISVVSAPMPSTPTSSQAFIKGHPVSKSFPTAANSRFSSQDVKNGVESTFTSNVSTAKNLPNTSVVNTSTVNPRVSITSMRPSYSVPLHIYEDHSTASPSTYMTHNIVAPTSVTPASSTIHPSVSVGWPPASRTPNQATQRAVSAHTQQPTTVITAQPLPSASVLAMGMAGPAGNVTVGVVSPTVALKVNKGVQQTKLISVAPATASGVPSAMNTVISGPAATRISQSPTQSTYPVVSVGYTSPGPSAQVKFSDNSKQIISTSVQTSASEVVSSFNIRSVPLRLTPLAELEKSPLHKACAKGDVSSLQAFLRDKTVDCNQALKDGTTSLHCAAEFNKEECLRLLLESGAKPSSLRDDRTTPLHFAAFRGHLGCLKLLLAKGAAVNLATVTHQTPLLLAVRLGHAQCCQLLLRHGANVLFAGQDGLSSIHLAVQAGHLDTLRTLLDRLKLAGVTRDSDTAHQLVAVTDQTGWTLAHMAAHLPTQDGLSSIHLAVQAGHLDTLRTLLDRLKLAGVTRDSDTAHQLVAVTDQTGWTLAHMAAHLPTQDCLVMLSESLPLDFDAMDKLGRTVREVASLQCKEILGDFGRPSSPTLKVAVELRYILENTTVSNVKMGSMHVGPGVGWRMMEERLRATLHGYLTQLDTGLRTRRIARMEAETADKGLMTDRGFTLGLTMANIKQFEMGFYKWTPGMQTDTSPYLILCNNEHKKVTITVDDSDFMCELIAFDVLHPVSSINNYLRLMEQYKSVIFYGPAGSGKSYLAHKLAQSIAAQEITKGRKPSIYQLTLQSGFTYSKFLAFLKQRNCVVPVHKEDSGVAPILLLDNLETVDIAQLFGELLDPMEYRGIGNAFCLRGDVKGNTGMHYLTDQFYVIGTMNKSRSLGVDLSILPRFRWVQFRLDTEPLKGLLARHFLRRLCNLYSGSLPVTNSAEDEGMDQGKTTSVTKEGSGPVVLRVVEWVVCVWQRLNDSLLKLGLPEVVVGPCTFFRCPLERRDPSLILDWLKSTWNQIIAPRVKEAVRRGTGSDAPSEGQQKVANTALYVLMQRSVILGCPLTGPEKDAYLAGFAGSNELDIPLKSSGGGGYVKSRSSALTASSPLSSQTNLMRPSRSASSSFQRRTGGTESPARVTVTPRARSVEATESHSSASVATVEMQIKNGHEEKQSNLSTSNIKRRSLSESNVDKAVKEEQQIRHQEVLDNLNSLSSSSSPSSCVTQSQAKVARLDVKSASPTKVISLSSAFRSPTVSHNVKPQAWDTSPRTVTTSSSATRKTGRVSPLLALISVYKQGLTPAGKTAIPGYKKSKSSENIATGAAANTSVRSRLSPGPFSFSLATPTSNLSSFKFLDKSEGDKCNADQAKRKGEQQKILTDMTIPDFSVFDKVPTPTEELPKSRGFVFVGRPQTREHKARLSSKLETEGEKEEVWSKVSQEEVWNKRSDGFVPIEKQEG